MTATQPIEPAASTGSPPRVLLFTDSDVFAGTERHILELALGLRELGVPVRIGCPSPSVLGTRAAEAGIATVTIQKGGVYDLPAITTLSALLEAGEIDVIHAHNGRTGFSAAISTSRCGGAAVVTQHFIEPGRTRQGLLKRMLGAVAHRWSNARVTQFIAISDAVREAMIARGDAAPERITKVANGISEPLVSANDAERIRAEFGIPAGTSLVVCVARLEQEKDIGSLIAALRQVVGYGPPTRALIVGDGAERAALQAEIDEAGLTQAVTLTGFRSDPLAFIAACDVFVLPSLAEPFGLAILEAMALSRPVVAVRAGGPAEIVLADETGRLVPPAQPWRLATALVGLLHEPEESRRMGEAGRARFAGHYTTPQMARATLAVYERAVSAVRAR